MTEDIETRRAKVPEMRRRRLGWFFTTILGVGAAASGTTLLLAIGTLFPAQTSLYTMISSAVWSTIGPHLLLLAMITCILALVAWLRQRRTTGAVIGTISAVALVWSATINGAILQAATNHGGNVNPVAALALGSMDASPDAVEVYNSADGQDLSAVIYKPAPSNRPAPVIMYVHGGGWINGTAKELGHDRRWFADHGYLVVSVDYRLATPENPTWDKAPKDVACALTWVRDNATRYGGDPDQLIVAGDSAGGNLAINLAYDAANGKAESSCGGAVPVPQAVIGQYPVVSPQSAYDEGFPVPAFEPQMFTERYLGGTPQQHPDRLAAISSESYLTPKVPQTLIIEPEMDGLIVSSGVFKWAEDASKAGADITVAQIPFANHIFNQIASTSLGNQASLTIALDYLRGAGLGTSTKH